MYGSLEYKRAPQFINELDTIDFEKVPRLTRERFKLYNVYFSSPIVSIVSLVNCIDITAGILLCAYAPQATAQSVGMGVRVCKSVCIEVKISGRGGCRSQELGVAFRSFDTT